MIKIPRIVILIPCFNRPQLTKLCFEHLYYFKNKVRAKWQVEIVVILSPEDSDFLELDRITTQFNYHKYFYKNFKLGSKMNAGIGFILNNFDFDYLMNFGSDDLIHPSIVDLYSNYIEKQCPFFGINKYYVYDVESSRSMFFRTRDEYTIAIGAGRMIHKSILDIFFEKEIPLYNAINKYLDSSSRININSLLNISEEIIDPGKFPYIVDIKTPNNITTIRILEPLTDLYEIVDNNIINDQYNIMNIMSSDLTNLFLSNDSNIHEINHPFFNINIDFNYSSINLINLYTHHINKLIPDEFKQNVDSSYLLKLYSDLFYGLMLENTHLFFEKINDENKLFELNKNEIINIHNSYSWKLTGPLRYVHSKLFRSIMYKLITKHE